MINAEVLEIKKRIKKDDDSTVKIRGCYVTGSEKEKVTYISDYLSNLPEEEQHKYIELLRKGLSGTLGKNLLNLEFDNESDESPQQSLLGLRASEFKSPEVLDSFYDYIIDNLDYVGNYLILLMYDSYDVPVKTSDNIKMDDSTEVFNYILCCICPVNLSKPGLSYHEDTNQIQNRDRDWVVDPPCVGFMFPAFNDRSTDIHNLLYYVKSTKELYPEFMTDGLGCKEKIPSDQQKQIFQSIIEETIINEPGYNLVEVVRDINENLVEMIDNNVSEEPVVLDKDGVKDLFKRSGIQEELLEKVEKKYTEDIGENIELIADSIKEDKSFEVKTNDVVVKMKTSNADNIKIKMVDGRKCLVVPIDTDIEVNGIMSRIKEELENAE